MTAADQPLPVRRALLSVSDKAGLVELARGLAAQGVELLSTGGTARALKEAGLAVTEVAEVTGFPEIMDGRVKTLHPKIHGGLLARRDSAEHLAAMEAHAIGALDLLVVNLYPFEATLAKGAAVDDCIENIDIGGPAMIRAAAKNHDFVAVLSDPADYEGLLAEIAAGGIAPATRRRLAARLRRCVEITFLAVPVELVHGAFPGIIGAIHRPARGHPDVRPRAQNAHPP